MISYIHCHIGQLPPDYLIDSFRTIDKVDPESRIIFVTDQEIDIDGVEVLQVKDIASEQTMRVMDMNLFRTESNQLWRTSIFRVFLVRDAMVHLNLDACYHFDSDVLMFQSSNKFEHLINDFDGLYITYHNNLEVVFGFSRFGSIEKTNKICHILHDVVFNPSLQVEYSSSGMANEMRLICGIMDRNPDLIRKLNIFPNETNIVFDPSSYGQFFGGTHQGHAPGFAHHTHDIGRGIQSGELVPVMIDKKPYVKYDGKEYPIVNLHIHSKVTAPFL